MTKVRFDKGIEANLPTPGMAEDGHLYLSSDNGNMYLGMPNGSLLPLNRSPYYGTCSTASETNSKVVTLDTEVFSLYGGVMITVRFETENTASSPTLNVNSTGAIAVKLYGTTAAGNTPAKSWNAGEAVTFVYDGSYWLLVGGGEENIGHLNTNNTSAQTPSASESFTSDISLHKVSKTGSYNDLNDKPDDDFVKVYPLQGFYNNNSDWNLYLPSSFTNQHYVRITIPDSSLNKWTMLYFELSIMQKYNNGLCGKLYFFAMHNSTTGDWTNLKGTIAGNLNTEIKLYASDRKYLYIGGLYGYGSLSIDKLLCGDSIRLVDLTGITLDTVTSLPETHQTGTIYGAGASLTLDSNGLRLLDSMGDVLTTISNSTAANTFIGSLPQWTNDPSDDVYLIRRDTGGSLAYGQVKFSTVWNYIKSKIASVLGIGGSNGVPTAPTAAAGTNTTQIATTAFVQGEVGSVDIPEYAIEELATPTSGFRSSYRLEKDGSTISGSDTIDIPNEFTPLVSKEYTGTDFYAASGTWNNSSRYFMSVRPDALKEYWYVKYRVRVWIPSDTTEKRFTDSIIEYFGSGISMKGYRIWNTINTSSAAYYQVAYWLTDDGYNNQNPTDPFGHVLGTSILYGTYYTTSSWYRHVKVDLLAYEGCEVNMFDNLVKWSEYKTSTGATNAATGVEHPDYGTTDPSTYNATSQGLQETGDTTDTTNMYLVYARFTAGTYGMMNRSLVMQDGNGKWQSFTTTSGTGASKTKNPSGFRLGSRIYYMGSTTNIAADAVLGTSLIRAFVNLIDFRYDLNITTTAGGANNLLPYKPLYIVGTIHNDGMSCYL